MNTAKYGDMGIPIDTSLWFTFDHGVTLNQTTPFSLSVGFSHQICNTYFRMPHALSNSPAVAG